jgi:NAD(P)-dependent dehydrogenase (short-subunit alcohol dehydrogenase family)
MNTLIIGARGAIGSALVDDLAARGAAVRGLSRVSDPPLDLTDDASIEQAATALADEAPFDLVIVATGLLHGPGVTPEKSYRQIDGAAFEALFRVNATGPALVMRHFLPLLARDRRASGRSGTIGWGAGSAIAAPRRRSTRSSTPSRSSWREAIPTRSSPGFIRGRSTARCRRRSSAGSRRASCFRRRRRRGICLA